MNKTNKKILLEVARDSIEAAVTRKSYKPPVSKDLELNCRFGCFVTIKNGESLRGCIGQFISDKPIIGLVAEIAAASATKDARFFHDPITTRELDDLYIEISLLSPLEKTDDPLSLRLGIDGIYIVKDGRSGCFLPQVATEIGWNKEEFLSYCCSQKAGLSPDAWKSPDTDVYLFTTDIFGAGFAEIL